MVWRLPFPRVTYGSMAHGHCTHPFSRYCAAWLTLWVCAINVHVGDGGCPRTVLKQIRNRVRWSLRKGFGAAVAELAGVAELVLKVPSAAKHCMITRTGMTTEILASIQHFWGLWSNLRKQLWRISNTNMLLDPNESPKSIVKVASCSNKKTFLVTQCARKCYKHVQKSMVVHGGKNRPIPRFFSTSLNR